MAPRGKSPGKQPAKPAKRDRKLPKPAAGPVTEDVEPQRLLAAHYLAEGRRVGEVAVSVGVTPRALYEWRRDPAFQALVRAVADGVYRELRARARVRLESWMESSKFAESIAAIDRILGLGDFAPPPLLAATQALGPRPANAGPPHGVLELPMLDAPPVHPDDEVDAP